MLRNSTSLIHKVANKCSINESKLTLHEKQLLNNLLLSISNGPINVLAQNPNIRRNFVDYVSQSTELCKLTRDWILKRLEPTEIMRQFNQFINNKFYPQLCSLRDLSLITDLSRPDQAFPQARQLNRKIFIHHGPPNSGKTHSSLLKLIQAKSGVYCAPLRLMAYEIFDKLTRAGIKTNLLTGQKRMIDSESSHLVCTVEMLPIGKSFDVGIIDEMQMVADESRGFAWCRAFFALQAKELHICGNSCALPIYTALANQCNETAQLIEYNRLTQPVKICEAPITLDDLKPRDCLVSFSPITLFQYKFKLECLGKKSCILYGSLPPETRLLQIERFNRGGHILLATDVIGMGLNLDIQRVILANLEKSIDGNNRPLSPLELSQIVNRAGRFGISNSAAECGVLKKQLLEDFKRILGSKIDNLCDIQMTLEPNQLITFIESIKSTQNDTISPAVIVKTFKNLTTVTKPYNLSKLDKMNRLSFCLEGINLTTKLTVEYLNAPLDTNHQMNLASLRLFASRHSDNLKIHLDDLLDIDKFRSSIDNIAKLKLYELVYSVLDYYQYMSFRYPNTYVDIAAVDVLKKYISNEITMLIDSNVEPNFYQPIDEIVSPVDIDRNFVEYMTDEYRGAVNYISCKFHI